MPEKSEDSRGWIVVVDETTGDFTVEGPAPDQARWEHAIAAAKAAGRKVAWRYDEGTRDEAVAQAMHQYGGKEIYPGGSIVALA
ncbi:hypothetical protein GCM10011390_34410 [Aureimonas endophytica]|uniref:Uncharacterized protein n=1 Tax=Aureimonas endophytica TaxID=2027858 RepID=A0A916ZTT5_9HYPH|nr:hypothetical protein [Aureimonas endophytica]GGE12368.1 hypothetical protein GCM10011390_34410 [Aureimonas endophytica]